MDVDIVRGGCLVVSGCCVAMVFGVSSYAVSGDVGQRIMDRYYLDSEEARVKFRFLSDYT